MTRRVVEKLCTKKVCVDFLALFSFLPPLLATPSPALLLAGGCALQRRGAPLVREKLKGNN